MGEKMKVRTVAIRALAVTLCTSVLAFVALPGVSQAAHKAKTTMYYVSVGDSYSVGFQPAPVAGATPGYTGYVATKLKMTLVNFGCGGATTASILDTTVVCGVGYGPPAATDAGTVPPGESQAQAAEAFITAHPGRIGLITVSIGGNDVTSCAAAAPGHPVNGQTDPVSCVGAGVATIKTNVTTLVDGLSAAAGPSVPIVGLTYPDVLLGLWVFPTFPASASNQQLASESTLAFSLLINPALSGVYTSVPDGKFVDVTAATGAYTPLTKLKKLAPYGKIPKAVVEVCKFTWYCSLGNIHANTLGYTEIGKLIKKAAG
jgi:lysophospholipase L1-like esterase